MRIYFYRLCLKKFTRFGIGAKVPKFQNYLIYLNSALPILIAR